jgi:hypothetical protein
VPELESPPLLQPASNIAASTSKKKVIHGFPIKRFAPGNLVCFLDGIFRTCPFLFAESVLLRFEIIFLSLFFWLPLQPQWASTFLLFRMCFDGNKGLSPLIRPGRRPSGADRPATHQLFF